MMSVATVQERRQDLLAFKRKVISAIYTDKKHYDIGDTVKFTLTFKDGQGIYVDPDAIEVYHNNKLALLEKLETGVYNFIIVLGETQQHRLTIRLGNQSQSFIFNLKKVEKMGTDFKDILNRTLDDTIKGILGERATEIYSLMNYYGIRTEKLGENAGALEKVMTKMFNTGWTVFKNAILRSLCKQLNLSMEIFANHSFVQCIEIAEREFSKQIDLQTRKEALQIADSMLSKDSRPERAINEQPELVQVPSKKQALQIFAINKKHGFAQHYPQHSPFELPRLTNFGDP